MIKGFHCGSFSLHAYLRRLFAFGQNQCSEPSLVYLRVIWSARGFAFWMKEMWCHWEITVYYPPLWSAPLLSSWHANNHPWIHSLASQLKSPFTFINCENVLDDEASDATKEDFEEMKAMFREAKRDPTSLWKNFTLPREYFLLAVHPQDEKLNQMKAMVQETKQDPMSLYKNFNLPENCLLELSRTFARMQNKSTAASTVAWKCTVMLLIK